MSIPRGEGMAADRVLALILAGGAGGRLDVLTQERAKPAMPFGGTYRLIDFSLSNCMHSRIADVWVVEQYEPHSLNDHLANGRPWDLDRTYGGLQVLPPFVARDGEDQDNGGGFARGNADALYRNRKFIQEFAPDVLLVMSADHVYKLNYAEVLAAHRAHRADVTLVTTRVSREQASRFGVVKTDTDGRIIDFAYKPEQAESDVVTAEVFAYDAQKLLDTLDHLVEAKRAENSGEEEVTLKDYGHELLPHLVAEGRAFEYRLDGYWRDLGTVESYWQGHMDLLAHTPPLDLDDPRWPILTYGSQRMPARVEGSASITNSLLSPGCHVQGTVMRSVLSPGVKIEPGAEVCDSILLHDVVVRQNARINCAVIDEKVVVEQGAQIGGKRMDVNEQAAPEDITIIGMRNVIAAHQTVQAGERLKPVSAEARVSSEQ